MPNHITNRLTVTGSTEEVTRFLDSIKGEWKDEPDTPRPIDFNKIKPMPESLQNCTEGGGAEFGMAKALCSDMLKGALPDKDDGMDGFITALEWGNNMNALKSTNLKDLTDEQWEHFKLLVDNIREHGYTSWYGWSIDNWGTKWNAYSQSIEVTEVEDGLTQATIRFDTAWGGVPELILPLMDEHENVAYEYVYADEDSGNNVGHYYRDKNGDGAEVPLENGSNEAYELYLELNPDAHEYIKFNEESGSYEYVEEDY